MMVVVPSSHRLAESHAVELAELKGEELVLFSRSLGPGLFESIMDACRRAGFAPSVSQIAPQITSIPNMVAVELGISIVPAEVANTIVPGVVFLPIRGNAPIARLALATRLDDRSILTKNFQHYVRTIARSRPRVGAAPVASTVTSPPGEQKVASGRKGSAGVRKRSA
jgi:DNA-binding transcriptional LysR family regulator